MGRRRLLGQFLKAASRLDRHRVGISRFENKSFLQKNEQQKVDPFWKAMEHVSCWQLWKFSWVLEGTNLWKMLFKLAKNGKVFEAHSLDNDGTQKLRWPKIKYQLTNSFLMKRMCTLFKKIHSNWVPMSLNKQIITRRCPVATFSTEFLTWLPLYVKICMRCLREVPSFLEMWLKGNCQSPWMA